MTNLNLFLKFYLKNLIIFKNFIKNFIKKFKFLIFKFDAGRLFLQIYILVKIAVPYSTFFTFLKFLSRDTVSKISKKV